MSPTLPSELGYGKVVAQFLLAVADTVEDVDVLPDPRAAEGTITFTPTNPNLVTVEPRPATVVKQPLTFALNEQGLLVDANGNDGVWMVAGQYTVAYNITGIRLNSHSILVTTDHTEAAPLDLGGAQNYVPPSGVSTQTVQVPEGAAPGQWLGWGGTSLEWVPGLVVLDAGEPVPPGTADGSLVFRRS